MSRFVDEHRYKLFAFGIQHQPESVERCWRNIRWSKGIEGEHGSRKDIMVKFVSQENCCFGVIRVTLGLLENQSTVTYGFVAPKGKSFKRMLWGLVIDDNKPSVGGIQLVIAMISNIWWRNSSLSRDRFARIEGDRGSTKAIKVRDNPPNNMRSFGSLPTKVKPKSFLLDEEISFNCGLGNLGNTCYLNAAIQSLRAVKEIYDDFLLDKEVKQGVAKDLQNLLKNMCSAKCCYPTAVKKSLAKENQEFDDYQQHDAGHAISSILESLESELNHEILYVEDDPSRADEDLSHQLWDQFTKHHGSVVSNTFRGIVYTSVTCSKCNHTCRNFEISPTLICLSVPESHFKKEVQLEELLRVFLEETRVRWPCSSCQETKRCKFKTSFGKLPQVLIFRLNRVQQCPFRKLLRIRTQVQAPLEFEFPCWETTYDLISFTDCCGDAYGGHYTTTSQDPNTKLWFLFNDSHVSRVTDPKPNNTTIFLVYRRRARSQTFCQTSHLKEQDLAL
eukprot:TRINITY_DN11394_c0_g1_i1.p1 TRINITY_DN11394_c0_g1~~TRINITY_DN11394_c0_g1_i1.p1  ORF type:complete len:503 (-),score=100.09 TRINITY_DN11394_c0_g1_i1:52-1560(-)